MRQFLTGLILTAVSLACTPVMALDQHPPKTAAWQEEDNGDAVQVDLGFVLPRQWKNFTRDGFTSTREDGASVKTYYSSGDRAIRLAILVQLRVDARGIDMPEEAVWSMVEYSADLEYAQKSAQPDVLAKGPFSLGGRSPLGRHRWAKYPLATGDEVQGLWWQNIGLWSVIITARGPESQRVEVEKAADTLLAEMPFPSAPLATEFAISGAKILAAMPKCKGGKPQGTNVEVIPDFTEAAALSLLTPGLVLGKANNSLISPITHANSYCIIETFNARQGFPVTAIQYQGEPSKVWEVRFGFAINNGVGGYYQVERLAEREAIKSLLGEANLNHAYLNFSNNKRASLFAIFEDWPSYEAAKKVVYAIHADPANRLAPILTMTNPAQKLLIVSNNERIKPAREESDAK
jgi:hypothetical protein